jgi:hypothetical protein
MENSSTRMRRLWVAPFVKAFAIQEHKENLFCYRYWWADVHEWPADDILDIFLYISGLLSGSMDRHRLVALWTLMQKGLSATEASHRLEQSGFGAKDTA